MEKVNIGILIGYNKGWTAEQLRELTCGLVPNRKEGIMNGE